MQLRNVDGLDFHSLDQTLYPCPGRQPLPRVELRFIRHRGQVPLFFPMGDVLFEVEGVGDGPTGGDDAPPARATELIRQSIRYAIVAVLLTFDAMWVVGKQRNLIDYLFMSELVSISL